MPVDQRQFPVSKPGEPGVVGHDDQSLPRILDHTHQEIDYLFARLGVEVSCRLIGKKDPGRMILTAILARMMRSGLMLGAVK